MPTIEDDRLDLRIRAEYLESPGLKLTKRQAQRLWGMDRETCEQVLEHMVKARFLRRRHDDTYVRFENDR